MNKPDYNKIFLDLIKIKFPEKLQQYKHLLTDKELSSLDVLQLNKEIFGTPDKETHKLNQRGRSYDKETIFKILDYQRKNKWTNVKLAQHFQLSRNTITSWKRKFNSIMK